MKVLLLNPPTDTKAFRSSENIPLGLIHLTTNLLNEGHEARLEDFTTEENFVKRLNLIIRTYSPDVLALNCYTENRKYTFEILKYMKQTYPHIITIAGGVFFSALPLISLEKLPLDVIVTGEGEQTTLELMRALKKKKRLKNIRSILYKEKGLIKKTKQRPLIKDINNLPIPDYKLFLKKYNKKFWFPMMSSRGCVYNCSFCSTTNFWMKKIRVFDIDRILEEIKILKECGFSNLIFYDTIFNINKKRTENICKQIIKEKLDLKIAVQTRIEFVKKDILKLLRKAGCKQITLGIESGSQKVLNQNNKGTNIKKVISSSNLIKNEKIHLGGTFVIGLPGETWNTVKETAMLLRRISLDKAYFNLATIYPGTPLYELSKKQKITNDESWFNQTVTPFYTGSLSLEQLAICKSYLELIQAKQEKQILRSLFKQMVRYSKPQTFHTYLRIKKREPIS